MAMLNTVRSHRVVADQRPHRERKDDRHEQGAMPARREVTPKGFTQSIQDAVFWHAGQSAATASSSASARIARGDIAAHLRERAAVRGGERVEAVALHGLARDRAARARLSACRPAHGPHRLDQRRLARNRLEALDVDRDAIGRVEVRHRRRGHVRRARAA